MKQLQVLIILLALTSCTIPIGKSAADVPSADQQALATPEIFIQPTLVPSSTPEPSPTIGYMATALQAQQTADAANRLMVEATIESDQRRHEEASWTQIAAEREYQIWQSTATAAATSIPGTQTQIALNQAYYATESRIQMTAQVMTLQAPTQLVAMAQAESDARFAPLRSLVSIFGFAAFAMLILVITYILFKYADELTKQKPAPATEPLETVVTVRRENGNYLQADRFVVPCTATQLTALAEGVLFQNRTLAFEYWESAEGPFSRNTYRPVRHFLQFHRFAYSVGSGLLAVSEEGKAFLRAWLDRGSVPPPFILSAQDETSSARTSHVPENHAPETEGEGLSREAPAGWKPVNPEGMKP